MAHLVGLTAVAIGTLASTRAPQNKLSERHSGTVELACTLCVLFSGGDFFGS